MIARRVLIAAIVCSLILLSGCITFRERYVNSHPGLDDKTREAILKGQIFIGMTAEQVEASWGSPDKIHKSVGATWSREQWVYGGLKPAGNYVRPTYVYFEKDRVTGWQK